MNTYYCTKRRMETVYTCVYDSCLCCSDENMIFLTFHNTSVHNTWVVQPPNLPPCVLPCVILLTLFIPPPSLTLPFHYPSLPSCCQLTEFLAFNPAHHLLFTPGKTLSLKRCHIIHSNVKKEQLGLLDY